MFWTQITCMVPETYPGGRTIFMVEIENLTDLPQDSLIHLNAYHCPDFANGGFIKTMRSGVVHFEPFEYKAALMMEIIPNPLPPALMECPLGYGIEVFNWRNNHLEANHRDSVWVYSKTYYIVNPVDRLEEGDFELK